jgi:DinB superfamily
MDYAEPPHDREPVTTIAWRLAHLIDVFGPPTASHFDGPPADHRAVDYSGTAHEALRQLDDGHDAWISDVRRLGAAGIARPQGAISPPQYADAPLAKLILYTNLEVIHHGAEICLLRDLYLWKDGRDGL